MSHDSSARNLRVGLFLAAGLIMGAMAIFALGEKSGLFEGKTKVHVFFDDISGLVEGAPVRLAGLDVGTVSKIEFAQDLQRREARVTLSIKSKFMRRIRRDSVALIDSKGLLGDKIINITLGSEKEPIIPDGGALKARKAPSIEHLASSIEDAVASISQVAKSADTAIQKLSTEQVRGDIGRITASTANLLEQVERGDSFVHRVLYDPKYAEDVGGILVDTRVTIVHLRSALERIDRTVAAVEHGEGMAHEIIYGDSGKAAIADLRGVASDLSSIVREVRSGDGLAHGLIYGEEKARALTELSQAATRINRIMGDIEKGRGTIGGLMVDPSVYEDLKTVLGNVERNVLLKALIRFTIKEGDIERPATLPVKPVQADGSSPSPAAAR